MELSIRQKLKQLKAAKLAEAGSKALHIARPNVSRFCMRTYESHYDHDNHNWWV